MAREHGPRPAWSTSTRRAWPQDINPFDHGSAVHTDIMKTAALKQALDHYRLRRGVRRRPARRGEEPGQGARLLASATAQHRWDPKNQRPELWNLYNGKVNKGESIRVFPLSNWTELDVWQYIHLENIPIVPLYFADERPGRRARRHADHGRRRADAAAARRGADDERVRFRTLGCYPLTGAIESDATTLPEIIEEMLLATTSERQGRVIDHDETASMEQKKRRGTSDVHADRPASRRHRRLPRAPPAARSCCASSPAAASTTARAR